MQNSTTATYPFTESALLKRPLPARIRGTRRRYAAIYKAKKNRFFYNTGLVAGGLPLILKLKKHFSAFALSVSSVWHFLLRCFFYIVIVFCRIFPIAAAPFVRVVKAASPSLREVWRKFIHWKDTFLHSPMGRIPAVAMIGVFTAMILSVNYFGLGLEVSIDGENVGYVSDQEEVDSVIRSVENRSAFYLNHPYSLNVNVGYKLKLMDRSKIINPMELEEKLFTKVNEVSNLYVLKVNGNLIGANASKTAIDLVLDKILKQYETGEPNVKTQFVQDVSVTEMPVANAFLKTPDELMSILKGQEQPKSTSPQKSPSASVPGTYVVKGGDTASGIAKENNISLRELKKANPDFNPDKLSIGQKLNLPYGASEIESPSGSASSHAGSVLTVKQIKRISYTEKIAYETVNEKSDSLYKNSKKVLTEGMEGQAKLDAEVTLLDGKEISRDIKSRVVVRQPVNEIVQIGTKALPAKHPTGVFRYPLRGLVTSNYGYRHGEFHTGVDFAAPIGTKIAAADGGRVVFAGRKGNYGKCIIISHGNGIETLYGHCSALLVTSGQEVGKGEIIARVGSTGRSTGPHCHFEVRISGNHVSPWKYLR